MTRTFALLILSISLTAAKADVEFTFTVLPGGTITGSPGQTVGWGYSITNNTTNWLGTLDLDAPSFVDGTPISLFDFPVVGPSQTVTETFNSSIPQGLYEFTWNSNAPIGVVNSGTFIVTAQLFGDENDALNDTNPISPNLFGSQSYSVTSVSASIVPEPGTRFLLLTIMALILVSGIFREYRIRVRTLWTAVGFIRKAWWYKRVV